MENFLSKSSPCINIFLLCWNQKEKKTSATVNSFPIAIFIGLIK